MLKQLKKSISFRGTRGMTLVEVMVAVTLLSGSLIALASMVSMGLLQLQNMRMQRTASNCGRVVMEFLETIPPDVIYQGTGAAFSGDFFNGGGPLLDALAAYMNQNNGGICRDLSNPAHPMGERVNLQFDVCPGCYTYTNTEDTGIDYTTCYYFYRVRVRYQHLILGGSREENYFKKQFYGTTGVCDDTVNPLGCGTDPAKQPPGLLKDCIL